MSNLLQARVATRLERLPISGWHTKMRLVLGFCTMFDAYDALSIAFIAPALIGPWHLTPTSIGVLLSSGFAGQVIGAGLFGWVGERFGRIRALNIAIVLLAVFGLLCATSRNLESMASLRFMQGIGLGGLIPVAATYVNEMAPTSGRGRFTLIYQLVYPLGLAAAGSVSLWLVPRLGWHWVFIIGAAPIFALIPIRLFVPESPRWLARHGRIADAEAAIASLERRLGATPGQPLALAGERLDIVAQQATRKASLRCLFSKASARRTIMLWIVWFVSLSIGYGLLSWIPTVFHAIYKLPLKQSLLYTFISQIAGLCCVTIAVFMIDIVGRKRMICAGFVVGAVSLAFLATLHQPSPEVLAVMTTFAMASIGVTQISLWTYTPELYPTRSRSIGTGAASTVGRLGSMTAPYMIGMLLSLDHSVTNVFVVYACFAVLGAAAIALLGVETAWLSLEEVSPDGDDTFDTTRDEDGVSSSAQSRASAASNGS